MQIDAPDTADAPVFTPLPADLATLAAMCGLLPPPAPAPVARPAAQQPQIERRAAMLAHMAGVAA